MITGCGYRPGGGTIRAKNLFCEGSRLLSDSLLSFQVRVFTAILNFLPAFLSLPCLYVMPHFSSSLFPSSSSYISLSFFFPSSNSYHVFTTYFHTMKPNLNQSLPCMERVLRQGHHQNAGKKHFINTANKSFGNLTKSVGTIYRNKTSIYQEINSRLNSGNVHYHSACIS